MFCLAYKYTINGVITGASNVETAVIVTDKATLPFAKYVMTFEDIPPGLAPSKIIPKANSGGKPNIFDTPHPKNGITENCSTAPTNTPLGYFNIRTKSSTVSVAPIPNIAICNSTVRNFE